MSSYSRKPGGGLLGIGIFCVIGSLADDKMGVFPLILGILFIVLAIILFNVK